ncbi:hypothetical protein [Sansalvadorimonas verongulae]|uniref:hypothetical protein n=1 Tax=Sansalvadorimonas verongulae TaxID=2172824 RepID=UPI0012BBEE12|nr:hypothetical protein [Sansalvadorimonas verongulae]MTI11695.1 hypothetical protein [Sansalvadorimonas verongulae]
MSSQDMNSIRQSAIPVFKGASLSDVAKTQGMCVHRCREYLHKYCRRVNRDVYEELAVEAAVRGVGSPTLSQLRNFAEEFLVSHDPSERHNLSVQAAVVSRLEYQLRRARVRLAVMGFDQEQASSAS